MYYYWFINEISSFFLSKKKKELQSLNWLDECCFLQFSAPCFVPIQILNKTNGQLALCHSKVSSHCPGTLDLENQLKNRGLIVTIKHRINQHVVRYFKLYYQPTNITHNIIKVHWRFFYLYGVTVEKFCIYLAPYFLVTEVILVYIFLFPYHTAMQY